MSWVAKAKRLLTLSCGYNCCLSLCEVVDWCYPPASVSSEDNINGGYGAGDVPKTLEDQCHINVFDARLDPPDVVFQRCFNVPCLIRNAVDSWWTDAWTLKNLSEVYGDIQVKTNTSSIKKGVWRKLSDFVESEMLRSKSAQELRSNVPKIWDGLDNNSQLGKRLRQETKNLTEVPWSYIPGEKHQSYRRAIGLHPNRDRVIPHMIAEYYTEPQVPPRADAFVAGGPCSGTYMHSHGPAIATLPHGMKRWAFAHPLTQLPRHLVPIRRYHNASITHYAFFEEYVPRDLRQAPKYLKTADGRNHPVLLCTQRSGDAVFTPARWSHATMNVLSSVAAVTEFAANSIERTVAEKKRARRNRAKDVASLYERYRGYYPDHKFKFDL
eukprot:TRINITY_DN30406_c0_g2_i1.p1 TRINITY_DN30406_c0_g2~~TRINITY_DN30406_c0_g2_i1.p1  ORF type:complete len:393 (-),score=20.08 TRINITY_DN30406_c0_g2_i1:189-1334(-)